MGDIPERSGELRYGGEHSDRTGEGGPVRENVVAAVGNPVSAGSRIVTVGRHDRLDGSREIDLFLDLGCGKHCSARRVDPEDHSLDSGVGAYFCDDACEGVSADVHRVFLLDDVTVGIDDRDLVLCPKFRLDLCGDIFREHDETYVLVAVFPCEGRELFLVLLDCECLVGKLVLHHVPGQVDGKIVYEEVERIHAQPPAFGGFGRNGLPHRIYHLLVLKHVLRAWRVLDIGLSCALVLSVADELESDPELVEQVLQEYHPAADADEEVVASVVAGSVDLVGYRCEIV